MDAGIADTINRQDAAAIAARLDQIDASILPGMLLPEPWYRTYDAEVLLSDADSTRSERVWLIGLLSANVPGIRFDGEPADGDWDNLFSHMRAEILARRDPKTPHGEAATSRFVGVV